MLDLKEVELPDLIDLLAEQAAYHSRIKSLGAKEEALHVSTLILVELQNEIELRQVENINQTITSPES